jgi:drug/metabolite transporter (DMT)-like permease
MPMSHRKAVGVMLLATLMWSIAGVVTRHLDAARSFEVTFWRSLSCVISLSAMLLWLRGPQPLWRSLRTGGATLWGSGLCWTVMFTAFMMALTLTTVANVLVTMALGPLMTALLSRLVLGHRLVARTWAAIVVAGAGIAWMYAREFSSADPKHLVGTLVAMCVPLAAAINWTVLHHNRGEGSTDMLPAVLIGSVLSTLVTLPLSLPWAASAHDVALLGMLGFVQLAVPCLARRGRGAVGHGAGRRRDRAVRAGRQRNAGAARAHLKRGVVRPARRRCRLRDRASPQRAGTTRR